MARICEFYGVSIYMYPNDHPPPHLHAWHGGAEAKLSIRTGEVIAGWLPKASLRAVRRWIRANPQELEENWIRVWNGEQPLPMESLK